VIGRRLYSSSHAGRSALVDKQLGSAFLDSIAQELKLVWPLDDVPLATRGSSILRRTIAARSSSPRHSQCAPFQAMRAHTLQAPSCELRVSKTEPDREDELEDVSVGSWRRPMRSPNSSVPLRRAARFLDGLPISVVQLEEILSDRLSAR